MKRMARAFEFSGLALLATATLAACTGLPGRDDMPATWNGLERVDRPGLDAVYVRQGASLKSYRRVMLDPVEVSFDKNWDPSRGRLGFDTADPQAIRTGLAELARDVFRRELQERGGYELVTEPGPDVLRVRAQIVDLYIAAPETNTPGIVRTYVVDAGEMTLVADLIDSQTNTTLAHVKDRERGHEFPGRFQIANRVTNTAEARRVIAGWASMLRNALDSARQAPG